MTKVIGILVNPRKKNIDRLVRKLDDWILGTAPPADFRICTYDSPYIKNNFRKIRTQSDSEIFKDAELIITLGGDGTLLRTINKMKRFDIRMLGVNLGGLGFIADTPPDKLTDHIQNYLEGRFFIDERSQISCYLPETDKKFRAFNDIVIDKAGFARVIQIETHIDTEALNNYIADGLIVSTPTGSTGHSLSNGGPIVAPGARVFVINPICPHSLTNRPVIIPDDMKLKIVVYTEADSFNIYRDGTEQGSFPSGTLMELKRSEHTVKLVKMEHQRFFSVLSKKLHWGEDFRNKNRWTYKKI